MSTHNIGFYEDLTKIIFELSSNIIRYAPYYAPNFEKVDGAYCFWSVRGWVRAWVTLFVPTVTFKPLKLES